METGNEAIVVLDEGIEESAENLSGCCKSASAKAIT